VLLITGASSGIGGATARPAADRYRPVLTARRKASLDALAEELGCPGSR
jgi:NADP-dependent 3-hydroxy acid dehydrogenase YdfG